MRKKTDRCVVIIACVFVLLSVIHIIWSWRMLNSVYEKSRENLLIPEPRQNRTMAERYIIYVCNKKGRCGGWGDRLCGIVMTYLISLITKRTFGIRITSPSCDLTDVYQPNLVDWNIDTDSLKNMSHKRISHVDKKTFYNAARQVNFSSMMTKNVIYYSVNYEFIPRLQENYFHASQLLWMKHWTRDRVFAYVMRILFKLSKPLETTVIKFMKKVRPNNKWKLICAHIRMGKNPTIPKDTEVRNSPEEIELLWEFLKKNLTCDHCKLFIATDSEDIRQKAKVLFPNHIVDMPGKIAHIERGEDANMCDAFSKLILDQQILSNCDSLVISRSGFGKIAAYLRGTEENLYCFYALRIQKCLPNGINTFLDLRG